MTHLPIEECRWLRSKGFPQDCPDDKPCSYWAVIEKEKIYELYNPEDSDIVKFYRNPNLEELVEWAKAKLMESGQGYEWMLSPLSVGWMTAGLKPDFDPQMHDPDPKMAVVKLLKQVLGD